MTENSIEVDSLFLPIQEINEYSRGRSVTIFARGDTAKKTLRLLHGSEICGIVDNSPSLWEKQELGFTVQSPLSFLQNEGKHSYVVICTTSFTEVAAQLLGMGLCPQKDFCISPILSDYSIVSKLENIRKSLIFTSGAALDEEGGLGGGIYQLNINGDSWSYERKISGQSYGLILFNKNFISVSSNRGIFEFDSHFKIIREKKFPVGVRAHGVCYNKRLNCFYIACSYLDAVLVLDENFTIQDEIKISNKYSSNSEPHHHINDCWTDGYSLYVSMFSLTGNWKKEVYDGGVLEFDLESKSCNGAVMQNLWMPHNISFVDGCLTILDSLPGYLRRNNCQIVGQFPAFTRGLAYDGMFYYIGQSKNRNISKNIGISLNTSIDTGVLIFDERKKVSRLIQLPSKISELHSIICI
jgi:hypothetical protein